MKKPAVYKDLPKDKVTTLSQRANVIVTESINEKGKSTIREKVFDTDQKAADALMKKGWELLKKGYLFEDKQAEAGEASLHLYLGGGYTGALAFTSSPSGIYAYQSGAISEDSSEDFMLHISFEGQILDKILLPQPLAWDMRYHSKLDRVLLDLDHTIYSYDLQTKQFTQLTAALKLPVSFIELSADRFVYAAHPKLYIQNLLGQLVYEGAFEAQVIQGDICFAANLSKDGKLLALHAKKDEIALLDIEKGQLLPGLNGGFGKIEKLDFLENKDQLLLMEARGNRRLRLWDLNLKMEQPLTGSLEAEDGQDLKDYCLNEEQTLLAVLRYTEIQVYEWPSQKLRISFNVAHMVKTAQIRFVGDALAVRTDYGCLSLYKI